MLAGGRRWVSEVMRFYEWWLRSDLGFEGGGLRESGCEIANGDPGGENAQSKEERDVDSDLGEEADGEPDGEV